MLAHARRNTELAGLDNVTFIPFEKLAELPHFDFICSLLVFQHIPASAGYDLIRTLIGLLRQGGVAALQVRFRRAVDLLRFGRSAHPRSRLARREVVEQSETDGESCSDDYAQRMVLRDITAAG